MLWLFRWLGPGGSVMLAIVLAAGSVYGFQKAQIWWYQSKEAHCKAKLDDRQKELDDLKAQVAKLEKERNNAQSQANAAWKRYADREKQFDKRDESDRAELESLRGTYDCKLPDHVKRLWDGWNKGPGRNEGAGEGRPAPLLRPAPAAVGDRR